VVPVGSTSAKKVDAGIIAATNKDLQVAVQDGTFRKDLYFRLAQFVCQIPALRDRKDDILLLAHHFVLLFTSQMGRPVPSVSEEAKQVLLSYDYPGNIRELKNIMERAVIESSGAMIQPDHLHFFSYRQQVAAASPTKAVSVADAGSGTKWPDHLSRVEKAILDYIDKHGSIRNAECRNELKINIDQAYYLLNQLEKSGLIRKIGQSRGTRYILENA